MASSGMILRPWHHHPIVNLLNDSTRQHPTYGGRECASCVLAQCAEFNRKISAPPGNTTTVSSASLATTTT